jgi:hypothetical protein
MMQITIDIYLKVIQLDTTNTWEKKTITFAGDTSGAFGNDNAVVLYF